MHLAGILSSRFAHDARSQEHKVEQVFIVKYFVFCAYVFFFSGGSLWCACLMHFFHFLHIIFLNQLCWLSPKLSICVNDTMNCVLWSPPDHDCSIAQTSCIRRDLPVPTVQTTMLIHHEDRSLFVQRHLLQSQTILSVDRV